MTIIGLDVGTVRIGVASADDQVKIPFPVAVWPRAKYEAERRILELIAERGVMLIVVGMPLSNTGERTKICDSIDGFVRRLAKRAQVKIEYVDEAFSTVEASEKISQITRRGGHVDAHAACLILDRYFEMKR